MTGCSREPTRTGRSARALSLTIAAWFVLVAAQPAAEAQEVIPSDEMAAAAEIPTVFGASKLEEKVSEAPSYVTIVSRQELKKLGYKTLADVLAGVTSFHVVYDRNYHYVGVRGFGPPGDLNTRTLVLVNGHRVNDNIFETGAIGTDAFLDVNAIERVEIIRGPSSSLYGTNAFFGIINIVTRAGRDMRGVEVSAAVSQNSTYKAQAAYGKRFNNGFELFAAASVLSSQGADLYFPEFNRPAWNKGITVGTDYDQFYKVFAQASFKGFVLQGGYNWRKKGIPTASYAANYGDTRNHTVDARGFVELKYERQLAKWVGIFARAYYDQYDYEDMFVYTPLPSNDQAWGKYYGAEVRSTAQFGKWGMLIAGGEFQHHVQQDQRTWDDSPAVALDSQRRLLQFGVFLQATATPVKPLRITAGVRYDYYNQSSIGGTVNPRAAIVYTPWRLTTLKAMYGTAFRAPTVYEGFYNDGGLTSKSNPNLSPEKIQSGELVVEQRLFGNVSLIVSGFWNQISNLIEQVTDPADQLLWYVNKKTDVRALGVEATAEGKWTNGLEARVGYAFQRATDTETDQPLLNSPQHLVKARLMFPLFRYNLFGSLEGYYVSSVKTTRGNDTDPYILVNLALFSQRLIHDSLDLSLSVLNIFDKAYYNPGSTEHSMDVIRQNGRTFWLEGRFTF
jgi:outer membrane receptor for ferrienterochelin and colicins